MAARSGMALVGILIFLGAVTAYDKYEGEYEKYKGEGSFNKTVSGKCLSPGSLPLFHLLTQTVIPS